MQRLTFWLQFCLDHSAEHLEILEVAVAVADREDMPVETGADTEMDTEAAEDIAAFPCRLRGAGESFLKGFDKQNLVQDFLFVHSLHCCLN